MGFLDRLAGGRRQEQTAKEEPAAPAPAPPSPQPTELQHDVGSKGYGPPTLDLPTIANASLPPGLSGLSHSTSSSGRLYDPYEGISAAASSRKHLFRLPEQPEFVFEEEAAVRRRGWTENLQFYTGAGYLAGGAVGVSAGAYNYVTTKAEIPLDSIKLKANRLLNLAGARAKPFGNGAAILGLYFASFESLLASQLDAPGVPESAYAIAAGGISGAAFRLPRGPRQAAVAGVVGLAAGAGISALRTVFPSL